jgi:hypothetical protein
MKKNTLQVIGGLALLIATTSPAFALNTTLTAARAKDHGDAAIDMRIKSLNVLDTRIQAMTKVSATDKAGLDAMIMAQVDALSALKTKINADTDAETVRADDASITKAFRVYLLVIPKARIMAAADKVLQISTVFSGLSAKLQIALDKAATANVNVSTMNKALGDINSKVADANLKANSALTLVTDLGPDNGNAAIETSNTTALTNARAMIKLANEDLKSAQADAKSIVSGLKSNHMVTSQPIKVAPASY